MSDKSLLQIIALEGAIIIAMLLYAASRAQSAITAASNNPIVNALSGFGL